MCKHFCAGLTKTLLPARAPLLGFHPSSGESHLYQSAHVSKSDHSQMTTCLYFAISRRQHPELGLGAECASPSSLAGSSVAVLLKHQLPCSSSFSLDGFFVWYFCSFFLIIFLLLNFLLNKCNKQITIISGVECE